VRAWVGYLLLVVTALGWAGAWVTARLAAHELPPLTVAWGRFLVASVALLPAWLVLERGRPVRFQPRDRWLLLGMSLTGIVAYTVVFMMGVARAPASDGAVLTPGLAGVFAMTLSALLSRRVPESRATVAAALATTGCFLVGAAAWSHLATDRGRLAGDLLYVAGAAVWGVYTVLGRKVAERVPAVTAILLASVVGLALLTPLVVAHDGTPHPSHWSERAILNVLYLGLGATALAFVTYYLAVRIVGVDRTAPGLGLVPIFGVLGAATFLGERLAPLHIVGGVLVVAGIVLAARASSHAREVARGVLAG
jgi:drug/metabolite transporter (DMT)-like permease